MVVAMREAIGSMPIASRSGGVSVILPRGVRPSWWRRGGSGSPWASTKVSSTQLSAGIASPSAGRSLALCGIGVIADIGCVVTVSSLRAASQTNSVGPSSGGRWERMR